MAAQMNYNYGTPKGVPGGKVDISFDEVVTRKNEESNGTMKFGMAAAVGSKAGIGVALPTSETTAAKIDGVVIYHPNTEQDMDGNVVIKQGVSLGIMKKGHVWGRTSAECKVTYGGTAYVVVDGDYAGCFTNESAAYSAYIEAESTASGAKEVVADTATPTSSQIKLASVTPVVNGYEPAVGDYIVSKQIHGATVDIGAKFGNAKDDGIAVIALK